MNRFIKNIIYFVICAIILLVVLSPIQNYFLENAKSEKDKEDINVIFNSYIAFPMLLIMIVIYPFFIEPKGFADLVKKIKF